MTKYLLGLVLVLLPVGGWGAECVDFSGTFYEKLSDYYSESELRQSGCESIAVRTRVEMNNGAVYKFEKTLLTDGVLRTADEFTDEAFSFQNESLIAEERSYVVGDGTRWLYSITTNSSRLNTDGDVQWDHEVRKVNGELIEHYSRVLRRK